MYRRLKTVWWATYQLFADSGLSMSGAIAFSFVLSVFPFCIFLGALAGMLGGQDLASSAVTQLFKVVPKEVGESLAPEIEAVMGQSRIDLLTVGGGVALFFATSAIESLRSALNFAYRVKEDRSYIYCLAQSSLFVFGSALGMLALAWGIVIGPQIAASIKPAALRWLLDQSWTATFARYAIVVIVLAAQLSAYHHWLAAGRRRLRDQWPGIVLSIVLMMTAALLYGTYLNFYDYARYYGGLAQLMAALFFFQVCGMIIILGAEFNRQMLEARGTRTDG